MVEMEVLPGARIDLAIKRLVARAPAFMVFNGTLTEARVGDTVQAVYERWCAARPSTEPADLRPEVERLRAAIEEREADIHARIRAETERLRALVRTIIDAHDGVHTEDCVAVALYCDDADLDDDDCDCGSLKSRRDALATLGTSEGRNERPAPELAELRAENERLEALFQQTHGVRHSWVNQVDKLRAEKAEIHAIASHHEETVMRLSTENERLRAALLVVAQHCTDVEAKTYALNAWRASPSESSVSPKGDGTKEGA